VKKIAIVGGGISGLSAAYHLEKARRSGAPLAWQLFEQSARLGGIVGTEQVRGCVVETGADSFLSEKPWAFELCRELGLEDQLIGSNDSRRRTFVLVGGNLVPLPEGLQFIVPTSLEQAQRSELFSEDTKRLIANEINLPPYKSNGDESVAAFVARHFGNQVVERLADPMLAGVYGGRAANLSVRTIMPRFVQMEQEHGSLIRAFEASSSTRSAHKPIFTSLRNGMQQLVDAMIGRLDLAAVRTQCAVGEIDRAKQWRLQMAPQKGAGATEEFDALIIAIPAQVAAQLLASSAPELVQELGKIPYTSSLIVTLAFPKKELEQQGISPQGFGFLVPAAEKSRLLACTFVENKFSHRVPSDLVMLRGFLGGTRNEAAMALSDEEAVALVRREFEEILGITGTPVLARVFRWPRSMPQYEVGHLERVARIEKLCARIPGLYLIGNAYRGVGVPDCIREGREVTEKIVATDSHG
jgi:oxygen-dependent protoporphyrinogen oxidase